MSKVFNIIWKKSSHPDTEGQDICLVKGAGDDNNIVAESIGGGYSLLGASMADAVMQAYPEWFSEKAFRYVTDEQIAQNYGLSRHGGGVRIDGACGVTTVVSILHNVMDIHVAWEMGKDGDVAAFTTRTKKDRFMQELNDLLKKYDATIDAECGEASDLHGVYDEHMVVVFGYHEQHRISNDWSVRAE